MDASEQRYSVRPSAPATHAPLSVLGSDGELNGDIDPKLDLETVGQIYRAMSRTRIIDLRLEKLQRQGRIGFHVGSLGEEAAIVASTAALRPQDWIFPCYREFGALLYRGLPLQVYIDNMYGNAGDAVLGRQMPDHVTSRTHRFASVSAPVGTQIPQAVGFGWAAKLKKDDLVSAVFFGDGATSTGEFHAGMNFAAVFETPTIFLCRNNRFAISLPVERQTAAPRIVDKAIGYGMRGVRVDGNDALATYAVVRDAVERASRGAGPTLIELVTYRLGGHSTSDDPRAYRASDEVDVATKGDPLVRLRRFLEARGAWDETREREWSTSVEAELAECIRVAESTPKPSLESMFTDVYAEKPWHLEEQEDELLRGPRARSRH